MGAVEAGALPRLAAACDDGCIRLFSVEVCVQAQQSVYVFEKMKAHFKVLVLCSLSFARTCCGLLRFSVFNPNSPLGRPLNRWASLAPVTSSPSPRWRAARWQWRGTPTAAPCRRRGPMAACMCGRWRGSASCCASQQVGVCLCARPCWPIRAGLCNPFLRLPRGQCPPSLPPEAMACMQRQQTMHVC